MALRCPSLKFPKTVKNRYPVPGLSHYNSVWIADKEMRRENSVCPRKIPAVNVNVILYPLSYSTAKINLQAA